MPAAEILNLAGREVAISNPAKVFFPEAGYTKLDLVRYYLAVAPGVLGAVGGRPMALKRFVHGAGGEAFFQKRAPEQRPDWIETVELSFPSGRTAREVVLRDEAQLAWVINLGCIDLNPHPVLADDLDHPDELRIDLDPVPGVEWAQVREVALATREVLGQVGLEGRPKTSGSRGFHIYCRIERRWTFPEVRRAAVALARTVEAAVPSLATSKWWKEERHGVFLDYNQNAKDRTIASAYSVRPTKDARVSAPLRWEEVADCRPEEFTLATVPARFARVGDPWAELGRQPGSLETLLNLADRHEAAGIPDAPWPPHYERQVGEAPRVAPSRRRQPKVPLIDIARAKHEPEARAALERWKERHPDVVPHLEPPDILVDSMRGRSSTWTRIRVNLVHVPTELRPEQEPLEVDYDPRAEWLR
jgi:bifunctional non-homologous end joining protein LigD